MEEEIEVNIVALVPTPTGCGIFLSDDSKTMAIFVDHSVAAAITMFMHGIKKPRPLTHDLMGDLLTGLGAQVQKVIVTDSKDETFFARIFIYQENELGKNLLELDARPSDSIALAIQQKCPIYVRKKVWNEAEDMTWALEEMEENQEDDPTWEDEHGDV